MIGKGSFLKPKKVEVKVKEAKKETKAK